MVWLRRVKSRSFSISLSPLTCGSRLQSLAAATVIIPVSAAVVAVIPSFPAVPAVPVVTFADVSYHSTTRAACGGSHCCAFPSTARQPAYYSTARRANAGALFRLAARGQYHANEYARDNLFHAYPSVHRHGGRRLTFEAETYGRRKLRGSYAELLPSTPVERANSFRTRVLAITHSQVTAAHPWDPESRCSSLSSRTGSRNDYMRLLANGLAARPRDQSTDFARFTLVSRLSIRRSRLNYKALINAEWSLSPRPLSSAPFIN